MNLSVFTTLTFGANVVGTRVSGIYIGDVSLSLDFLYLFLHTVHVEQDKEELHRRYFGPHNAFRLDR